MRIVHLTPGTGDFHCGSCLRDNALIKALRRAGHDAVMVPLYLPLVTDDEPASPELPVFAGGINLFLQEKLPFLRRAPRWLRKLLDSPRLLRAAAKRADMTSPRELGKMTVGSLRGTDGRQRGEWQRLIDWIGREGKPDILSLSNGLLNGLAPAAHRALDVPIICSLQGEDSFLDTLPDPWRTQSWELFRTNSQAITRYTAASEWYASEMARRLNLDGQRIAVVRNGIDVSVYPRQIAPPQPPVIGYLARQIPGKGLHVLIDAFLLLAPRLKEVRLSIAGTCTRADDPFITQQQEKLRRAGLWDRVVWRRELTFPEKIAHLQSLTVLSVPATYNEAFGLYIIESLACGVPVVEPDHAGPAELVRATGGGLLCQVDNPTSLAAALEKILTDSALRQSLAEAGHAAVAKNYTANRMAADFAAVCDESRAR